MEVCTHGNDWKKIAQSTGRSNVQLQSKFKNMLTDEEKDEILDLHRKRVRLMNKIWTRVKTEDKRLVPCTSPSPAIMQMPTADNIANINLPPIDPNDKVLQEMMRAGFSPEDVEGEIGPDIFNDGH